MWEVRFEIKGLHRMITAEFEGSTPKEIMKELKDWFSEPIRIYNVRKA